MRRITRLAALAALVTLGVNCGGGDGDNGSDEPTPGNLTIALTSPNSDDGAIKLTIAGPVAPTAITASAGLELFQSGPIGTSTTVIVTGDLAAGPLLTIAVADTRKDEDYSATVVQVASETYALRTNAGYSLAVSK